MFHPIYTFIVVALLILWIMQRFYRYQPKFYLWASCAILTSALALRNPVFGIIDMLRYSNYFNDFTYVNSLEETIMHSNGKDLGYWAITYLFSSVGFTFQQYVTIISIFIIFVWGWYMKQYSPNIILSSFILLGTGCYTFMFYGLRQALAFPFALICIDAWYKKKNKKSLLFLLIAFLCHWSSIAIIPFLIVSRLRFNVDVLLGYIIALVLIMVFSSQVGYLITFLFRDEYIDTYTSSGELGGLAILYLILLVWFFVALKDKVPNNYKYSFFLHGFMLLCMIQICSAYAYSFTRLNYFYTMSIMAVTVPMSLNEKDLKMISGKGGNKIVSVFMSLVVIVLMIQLFFSFINGNHLNDYVFFWEEIK